jgi:hypothetical protein
VFEDFAIGNLDEVENSGNRSRVGSARLSVYSEARGRILWLGFMSKGVLESNLDLGNLQRFILEKDLDSGRELNELKNWFESGSAYFKEGNRCVAIGF